MIYFILAILLLFVVLGSLLEAQIQRLRNAAAAAEMKQSERLDNVESQLNTALSRVSTIDTTVERRLLSIDRTVAGEVDAVMMKAVNEVLFGEGPAFRVKKQNERR